MKDEDNQKEIDDGRTGEDEDDDGDLLAADVEDGAGRRHRRGWRRRDVPDAGGGGGGEGRRRRRRWRRHGQNQRPTLEASVLASDQRHGHGVDDARRQVAQLVRRPIGRQLHRDSLPFGIVCKRFLIGPRIVLLRVNLT